MPIIRLEFEQELSTLRDRLLEMASAVDSMLSLAMRALTEQNVAWAEEVIARDDVVDALDIEVETSCMRLVALQQPVARDLRLVGTALQVRNDLERMGDHAVDIAKVARKLAHEIVYDPLVDLPRMADLVRRMLNEAVSAFINHDLALADQVIATDDEVDALFHRMRDDLHAVMQRQANRVIEASYLLFVAHYLERIADHVVNVAERVPYVETGVLTQLAHSHKSTS